MERMSDKQFSNWQVSDEAGELLLADDGHKDQMLVELWGWMQAERAEVERLRELLTEASQWNWLDTDAGEMIPDWLQEAIDAATETAITKHATCKQPGPGTGQAGREVET